MIVGAGFISGFAAVIYRAGQLSRNVSHNNAHLLALRSEVAVLKGHYVDVAGKLGRIEGELSRINGRQR